MIRHTFCHIPGIGIHTEQILWDCGVLSWDDVLNTSPAASSLRPGRLRTLQYHLSQSEASLSEGDTHYFEDLLPAHQAWRYFPDFRSSIAYLDIETTGMGNDADHITTIALYDGRSIRCYVHGQNLEQFENDILEYKLIVTYNGKTFDVPFIRRDLRIAMNQAHIDLRYVLKSLGYRGGLKGCERQLGIHRDDLDGVDGLFAVWLWDEFQRHRNEKALETLLAYNVLDVVNLETLMVIAYNEKLKSTPFEALLALPVPDRPELPHEPHRPTIEKVRDRMAGLFTAPHFWGRP
ncbi:MAG: ribonuclease H-like domain-containing protein [Syntrophobacteraceae bacterium]